MLNVAHVETEEGSEVFMVSDPKTFWNQDTALWVKHVKKLWGDDNFLVDSQAPITKITEVLLLRTCTFESSPNWAGKQGLAKNCLMYLTSAAASGLGIWAPKVMSQTLRKELLTLYEMQFSHRVKKLREKKIYVIIVVSWIKQGISFAAYKNIENWKISTHSVENTNLTYNV